MCSADERWSVGSAIGRVGLVPVEIAQDDVNLLVIGHVSDHIVREVQELDSLSPVAVHRLHDARGDTKDRREGDGAVSLVLVTETVIALSLGNLSHP